MVCADGAFLCNKNLQSKVFAGTYRLPAQTHIDHGKAYLGVSSYSGSPLIISFAPVSHALYTMPRINLSFCPFLPCFVRHFDNRIKLNRIELNCFASFWKDTFCATRVLALPGFVWQHAKDMTICKSLYHLWSRFGWGHSNRWREMQN